MPTECQPSPGQRDSRRRTFQGQQHASFSSQRSKRVRTVPVPRTRSPLSSRARRPRVPRPGTTPAAPASSPRSRGRRRAQYAQRAARYLFDFALARYVEQQQQHQQHNSESSRSNTAGESSHQGHHHGGSSAVGHAVTGVLLEQLIQEIIEYLARHNFFRRRNNNNTSAPRQPENQKRQADTGTQTSQSSSTSTEQHRRRQRRHRHSEAMENSLNRLSSELETTYDTLTRILRDSEDEKAKDETLRENADNLRRAITRCMARVESVQTRSRQRRRAAGSAGLSRETTGRG